MTVNERIRDSAVCYDADNPPSLEEGLPLSAARTARPRRETAGRRSLLRSCARAVAVLAERRRG